MAKIENKTEYARFRNMCNRYIKGNCGVQHCTIFGKTIYIAPYEDNWYGFIIYCKDELIDKTFGQPTPVGENRHYIFITDDHISIMDLREIFLIAKDCITHEAYIHNEHIDY